MPTDTVYGLACSAGDFQAAERLYSLKNRSKKPGTIIAASVDQLIKLGIKRKYLKPVENLWPNPISVIVPSEPQLRYLDQGKGALAVRVVADKKLTDCLEITGPLLTSSANLPGQKPAEDIEQAKNYFDGTVDAYYDGGSLKGKKPSTLIRIVDDAVEVLREGAIKINEKGEIESEV